MPLRSAALLSLLTLAVSVVACSKAADPGDVPGSGAGDGGGESPEGAAGDGGSPVVVPSLGAGQLDTGFGEGGTAWDAFAKVDVFRASQLFLPSSDGATAWTLAYVFPQNDPHERWRGRRIDLAGVFTAPVDVPFPTTAEPIAAFGPPSASIMFAAAGPDVTTTALTVEPAAIMPGAASTSGQLSAPSFVGTDGSGRGYFVDGSPQTWRAMRVTANGSVDAAYRVNVAGAALDVFAAAPDSQGRLFYLSSVSSSLTVRRVDASGSDDATFAPVALDGSGPDDQPATAVVDGAGRLWIAVVHATGPVANDLRPNELWFYRVDTTSTTLAARIALAPTPSNFGFTRARGERTPPARPERDVLDARRSLIGRRDARERG